MELISFDGENGKIKLIATIVGCVVILILFLIVVKLYRRRKIQKYRNTPRHYSTVKHPNIKSVPTISYGNATPIYVS
ncbi:hypothetical protein BCR36DRAFT_587383, partial [Piromyces finnis]